MAYDLIKGQTKTDWSRGGKSFLGPVAAFIEREARLEARAFEADLLKLAFRTVGITVFCGGVAVLGYNHLKKKVAGSPPR